MPKKLCSATLRLKRIYNGLFCNAYWFMCVNITELKCKWLYVWCDGWSANSKSNTCNNNAQSRPNTQATITNTMQHVNDMHIFYNGLYKEIYYSFEFRTTNDTYW